MVRLFVSLHLITAAIVGVGVFVGLPQRWWPVDAVGVVVVMVSLLAAFTVRDPARDATTALVCKAHLLVAGALLAALLSGAAFLLGVYGPLGQGGLVVFALVMALVIPYLVAVPALELAWLRTRPR